MIKPLCEGEAIKAIYKAASDDLEYLTRTGWNFLLRCVFPLYVLPLAIQSYFRYYVMHMAEASFELAYPTSFVFHAMRNGLNHANQLALPFLKLASV